MRQPLRIGNASGFYGDRFSAVREMLEGGPLDVLTGDYLAELTMLILGRARLKDPGAGYAATFLRQMEDALALAAANNVKIVTNAGGLNPSGLADRLRALAQELGLDTKVAYVEGDDLLPRAKELGLGDPLTANAYLGAWGIAECLSRGADVVVTGRVTDASLVVGPAAAHFGWRRDDWDKLAGATVAGHVLECGAQATGGNYAFFQEIQDARHIGFPIAEIHADGGSVITKHENTGGMVTTETVTAQLVYEIGEPRYKGPDVTTRFDTITLSEDGKDRVRIIGAQGEPPPPEIKVCVNHMGGFRNEVTFLLTGLGIEAKAELVKAQMDHVFGADRPRRVEWALIGTAAKDPADQGAATALLRCAVIDTEETKVGRSFSGAAVELALASYPGFSMTAPPGKAVPYGIYTPAYIDNTEAAHTAVLPDGSRIPIPPTVHQLTMEEQIDQQHTPVPEGNKVRIPLGAIAGARSGDKGGDANIGVWARTDEQWRWLATFLTTEKLHELLPETQGKNVRRYELPNIRAVNFVIEGLLQEGVAATTRPDPQGKALGEWLRARLVDVPEVIL